ncbi:HD-GYP domain-containing protein [Rhizobium sp. XQZ8]|uniref:HD-GYP domain-containing protein n=1 Tax=Rhizobium populisoli TaxID=2859785 RepID=UPI001C67C919|nr:HD-GYP domain-containing protein [Rhizobium populisoli]MBW6421782.1 HD-GYP domain-containing protein [Rhizobium populisoli]
MLDLTIRISKNVVRLGMYIEGIECPVSEFKRRRFMLESDAELQAIRNTSAQFVLVNCSRSRIDVTALLERANPLTKPSSNPAEMKAAIGETLKTARRGLDAAGAGELNLDDIGLAADAAIRMIDSAPDVFLEVTRLKTKDEATYIHSIAVSALMGKLATLLDMSDAEARMIGQAGMLHDVGKLLIPNAILNNPGSLTLEELKIVREHPELGYRHLRKFPDVPELILDICRLHHEVLDGSGYPLGLKADQISLPIRICTVCDVFDALTSERPYKKGWETAKALSWMFERPQLFERRLVIRLGSMFE